MIGIYGGAFNPVHLGHEKVVKALIAQKYITTCEIIPTFIPPHKMHCEVAFDDRVAMLEMAFKDVDQVNINTVEQTLPNPSYTLNTLSKLSAQFNEPLGLILGADAYHHFHTWHEPEKILELVELIVVCRPGQAQNKIHIDIDAFDVSSTQVRAAIQAGEPFSEMLTPAVHDFIISKKLYQ